MRLTWRSWHCKNTEAEAGWAKVSGYGNKMGEMCGGDARCGLSPLTHLEDLREGALTNISGDSVAAGNDRTNGERELRLVLEAVDVRVEEERQRDVR